MAGKGALCNGYIRRPSQNICQKTHIIVESENVVVIGAQRHNSKLTKNLLRMEVGQNSKFVFVHQAMREILTYRELKWVVLLCEEGYSPNHSKLILPSRAGFIVTFKAERNPSTALTQPPLVM